jgi:hypothetical protein
VDFCSTSNTVLYLSHTLNTRVSVCRCQTRSQCFEMENRTATPVSKPAPATGFTIWQEAGSGEREAPTTSIFNHVICLIDTHTYSPSMSYLTPFTSFFQSTKRISQVAVCRGSQQQRYVSLSTYACQRVNKRGPRATVHIRHRSTFLTMTHFSMSFISIGHFF